MISKVVSATLAAVLAATLAAGTAAASDICSTPKAEWQSQEALQKKLEAEGWKVKKIKVEDGCYEVYGTDAKGNRMESYFDPKSFSVMKSKSES